MIYKEDFIIFGKIECCQCKGNVSLLNTELSRIRKGEVNNPEKVVICLDCFSEIPNRSEQELTKGNDND